MRQALSRQRRWEACSRQKELHGNSESDRWGHWGGWSGGNRLQRGTQLGAGNPTVVPQAPAWRLGSGSPQSPGAQWGQASSRRLTLWAEPRPEWGRGHPCPPGSAAGTQLRSCIPHDVRFLCAGTSLAGKRKQTRVLPSRSPESRGGGGREGTDGSQSHQPRLTNK